MGHLQVSRHDKGVWLAAAMLLLAPARLPAAPSSPAVSSGRVLAGSDSWLTGGVGGFGVRSGSRKDYQRPSRESQGRRVGFGKVK